MPFGNTKGSDKTLSNENARSLRYKLKSRGLKMHLAALLLRIEKIAFCYFQPSIARNSGHFAPVINCQRNLISKMADKNDRSQGKRIPSDFLNNLSSVDLFYEEKSWNETPCKKMLGLYSAERLIATKQYAAVPFVTFS